jgi:hypothetical protein
MKKHIAGINRIVQETISSEYQYGINDCNIFIIKVIDKFTGSNHLERAYGKYDTLRKGMNLLKKNGYNTIGEFVAEHSEEVTRPIFGDIYIDEHNASLILHNNTWLEFNHETQEFKISRFNETKGKLYRIRK